MENIKKILKIKDQQFKSIKKDGSLIIIDANDPVFASSAINLLFGIKRVAIARQIKNDFEVAVSEISKIGSNLLLKGDMFYVKVEGEAKGFIPKDLEMAATSAIIEKTAELGAHPGTEEKHDKILRTFLTKSNGYVSIFSDEGLGGIPYGSHKKTALCIIFDELSAISCVETIKQGFDTTMIICYTKDTELSSLVKIVNQIIPRTLKDEIKLEFIRINFKRGQKNYFEYFKIITDLTKKISKELKMDCVSLPISPLIFPARIINEILLDFSKNGIIAYIPLGALEEEIFNNAKEIGIGKSVSKIKDLAKIDFSNLKFAQSPKTIIEKKSLTIKVGPNNVHEILDQLIEEKKI